MENILYYCKSCSCPVVIKFGSGKFCSRSCANKREVTSETKTKISEGVKKVVKQSPSKWKHGSLSESHKDNISKSLKKEKILGTCDWCGKEIILNGKRPNSKHFCDGSCRNFYLNANKISGRGSWTGVCVSKWEQQFQAILNEYGIEFEANKRDLIPSRYEIDIWLPKFNIAIELNGIWHYSSKPYGGNEDALKRRQEKDRIKQQEVESLGYKFIIFKDDEIKDKDAFFHDFCKTLV